MTDTSKTNRSPFDCPFDGAGLAEASLLEVSRGDFDESDPLADGAHPENASPFQASIALVDQVVISAVGVLGEPRNRELSDHHSAADVSGESHRGVQEPGESGESEDYGEFEEFAESEESPRSTFSPSCKLRSTFSPHRRSPLGTLAAASQFACEPP